MRAARRLMIFQVARNGMPLGEFTGTMMSHKLSAGELRADDLYWGQGMPDWRKLSEYGCAQQSVPALRGPRTSPFSYNTDTVPLVIDSASVFGFGGCLILLLGVFAPYVSVPLLGSMNYFQNGHGGGAILILVALASAFLTVRGCFISLWASGVVTMLCLGTSFIAFRYEASQMKISASADKDNIFAGLASAAAEAVQLEWGFALLLVGGILLLLAAAVGTGKLRLVGRRALSCVKTKSIH